MGGLTWRIGAFILAGLLVVVSGSGLIDGVRNRARIAALENVIAKQAENFRISNENFGICQANFRLIELALDRQRTDIQDLAAKSAAAGKRAEEAARLGKAARDAAVQASQRVLALPRPAPEMACTEAARLLRGPQ